MGNETHDFSAGDPSAEPQQGPSWANPRWPLAGGTSEDDLTQGLDPTVMKIAVEKAAAKGEPLDMTLNKIGVTAVGLVQKYMTDLRTPPNAASTIKKKGSSNPLIDSGALRQSVSYKITTSKPTEGL